METQNEIRLLADQEVEAVVGGRINNGISQRDALPKSPGGSISAGNPFTGNVEAGVLVTAGVWAITILSLL